MGRYHMNIIITAFLTSLRQGTPSRNCCELDTGLWVLCVDTLQDCNESIKRHFKIYPNQTGNVLIKPQCSRLKKTTKKNGRVWICLVFGDKHKTDMAVNSLSKH